MKMLQCLNPCQLHHYFVDFVNMKCMSWFTFLHLEKMELCGGGRDGWGELRSEPRAAHVFFIFQIKKELFIFIFQIKSISKGTF